MATVRSGNQAVLLIVDVQEGVMRDAWEGQRIIQNIQTALEKARSQAIPVIWVQHADDELVFGSPDWQIATGLAPAAGEEKIFKKFNSAFEDTRLEEVLAQYGASHVVLAGAATNWCIRATAYGAIDRGYDLTLIEDAHTTGPIEFKDGTTLPARDIVRELNVAMRWLTYPGRKNATVAAGEVSFTLF